jgi:hypothetical protein
MLPTLGPEGLRLLDELQEALRVAEISAAERDGRASEPQNSSVGRKQPPAVEYDSLAGLPRAFDRLCDVADCLSATTEAHLTELEQAFAKWLAAAESWKRELEILSHPAAESGTSAHMA